MQLVELVPNPEDALRFRAIQMLTDDAYHKTKASIMLPIHEFTLMVQKRTGDEIVRRQVETIYIRISFAILGAVMLWVLLSIYHSLHSTLGVPVSQLHK